MCKIYKEGGQKTTVICLHFSLLFETGSSLILMMCSKIATGFKQVSGLFGSASSPCFSRHTHISNTDWNLEKNAIRQKACSQNRSVFRILLDNAVSRSHALITCWWRDWWIQISWVTGWGNKEESCEWKFLKRTCV